MEKFLTILKLTTICIFIWMQAAQADHLVEQSADVEHVECLACKNLNDPIAEADPFPVTGKIVASSNKVTRTLLNVPRPSVSRSDLARAPPLFS